MLILVTKFLCPVSMAVKNFFNRYVLHSYRHPGIQICLHQLFGLHQYIIDLLKDLEVQVDDVLRDFRALLEIYQVLAPYSLFEMRVDIFEPAWLVLRYVVFQVELWVQTLCIPFKPSLSFFKSELVCFSINLSQPCICFKIRLLVQS